MSLLSIHSLLFPRFGRIVASNTLWVGKQLHLKEGLALKSFLTLVKEGKRKSRSFSAATMAEEPTPPEDKVASLHVTDQESKPSPWRRKNQHEEDKKLSTSVFVDASLLRFLVGKGASTKERIERDAGVSLRIPSGKDAKAGKQAVLVQGQSQEALDEATRQVHKVIEQAIKSPQLQYSHFVSIPLAQHTKLLDSVVEFQKSVLESAAASSSDDSGKNYKGIDKSIFVKPATFHLTLLMLKLWNEERVQAAADCLQNVMPRVHEALENSPLTIKLTGVDCMKGNPATAHVLYADVEPDDQALRLIKASRILLSFVLLYHMLEVITEAFTEAGLVMDKDQMQTLKLHATLMNTTQRSGGGHGQRFKKRIPFDATEVVGKYEQHEWGEYHVAEAHLSQRFVYDENGYYHCCTSVPFPPEISSHVAPPP